jgi:hypothetical protein
MPMKFPAQEVHMDRHQYNAASIKRVLDQFEAGYGMSSDDFFRAHVNDDESISAIPGRQRQAWAMFYRTHERMTESSFADRVSRELEVA